MRGRWRVVRMRVLPLLGFEHLWVAVSPWVNDDIGRVIYPRRSWREAQDYADRMTRRQENARE